MTETHPPIPDPTPFLRRLEAERDEVIEAKRYAVATPAVARSKIGWIAWDLARIRSDAGIAGVDLSPIGRLIDNLYAAREMVSVSPTAASGYLDGVAYELGSLIAGMRAEAGREARDAELAEAFMREAPTP